MCVMSMVLDHAADKWDQWVPKWPPYKPAPELPPMAPLEPFPLPPKEPARFPTQEELEDFRRLYERAKKYDADNNEPNCETDEKKRRVKELADKLGVNIDFIDEPTEVEK